MFIELSELQQCLQLTCTTFHPRQETLQMSIMLI